MAGLSNKLELLYTCFNFYHNFHNTLNQNDLFQLLNGLY